MPRASEVELASFTPLVFSTTGGMCREGLVFYCRLAELLSRHNSASYSRTLAWLRSTLSFSLLQSETMCIWGSRSISRRHPDAGPCKWPWGLLGWSPVIFFSSWVQHISILCWGWLARVFHIAQGKKIKICLRSPPDLFTKSPSYRSHWSLFCDVKNPITHVLTFFYYQIWIILWNHWSW